MSQEKKNPEPNNAAKRSTTNWRARQKRKSIFGLIKFFLVIVLLGVLVGFGIVFKDKIMNLLSPQEVVKKRPIEPPAPPKKLEPIPEPQKPLPEKIEAVKPPPPEPVKKVVPDRFVEAEETQARQLISRGLEAMQQLTKDRLHFDFGAGKRHFEEAATLKATKQTHGQAEAWVKKVDEFKLASKHIEIGAYSIAETSFILTLTNGESMYGLEVTGDDKSKFHIQTIPENNPATMGKSTLSIPKLEIAQTTPVSLAKRQAEFRQFLLHVESGLNLSEQAPPEEFYDLVFLSKRLGLARECIDYLDRAYKRCELGQLGNKYRKLVVDRAIERASLLAAVGRKTQAEGVLDTLTERTLPDYQVAQDEADAFRVQVIGKMKSNFRSTLALKQKAPASAKQSEPVQSARELTAQATKDGGGEEIVVDNSGITGNGAAAGIVAQANKEYEEGMRNYRLFRSGTGAQRNAALKKAADHLLKAVDLYGAALDKDPNNTAIANRQQEANMIRYGCMKYLTL